MIVSFAFGLCQYESFGCCCVLEDAAALGRLTPLGFKTLLDLPYVDAHQIRNSGYGELAIWSHCPCRSGCEKLTFRELCSLKGFGWIYCAVWG
jgi:hypothetical protein